MKIMSYVFWRVSLLRPKKKEVLVVCLAGARSLLQPEKNSSSCLSGGCAIVITIGKKSSSADASWQKMISQTAFLPAQIWKGGESIGTISVPARPYLEDQYLVF
jgi:hypothetical protein